MFKCHTVFDHGWLSATGIGERPDRPYPTKTKAPKISLRGLCISNQEPGGALLSHEETSHYHRRRAVSLPSSGRDRVVPARYCRQANWLTVRARHSTNAVNSESCIDSCRIRTSPSKPLGCYMVKPHGQLVLVSLMHCCTSTPSLSTS